MQPTEEANKRYAQGTVTNNMPKMFPNLQQRIANMKNVKVKTIQGKSGLFKNAASISQITGQRPNGQADTVYVETASHMPFVQVIPRMAGVHISPNDYSMEEAKEYDALGKRFKKAEAVSAKQQGGTIDVEQQVTQLVQAAAAGDQKATQQIEQIMQAAQQGNQEAIQIAQLIQKAVQAMQTKQGVKAKLGTKLDYLNKLKGNCPEGTEKVYLKNGGCMCRQKVEKGAELKKQNVIQTFKAKKGCKAKK